MDLRTTKIIAGGSAVLAAVLLLGIPVTGAHAGLDAGATDGYRLWLHSLERTVAGRDAAGEPEHGRLFPFDTPALASEPDGPGFRHLAIAKAVSELEDVWQVRDGRDGPPALVALANARNYMHLSEFDSALVWYGMAAARDTADRFREDIARETLAAAAAADDSLALARALANTLAPGSLAGRDGELVLAYRCLLTESDAGALDHLNAMVAAQDSVVGPGVRFWHAYALASGARHAESLAVLTDLVRGGGLSLGLDETQRTWVLTAIPDLMYLEGDADGARRLYGLLAESDLPALRLWGAYQAAGLDLADARYDAAVAGYETVCAAPRQGSWQDGACTLKDLASRLRDLRKEGETHGAAAFYDR